MSTDSATIATVARDCGAEVPFLRDPVLADDETPVSAVTVDAVERLGAGAFAHVAQLMPNCPLRTADDIRSSHEQFAGSAAPAQLSVARFGFQNPWWAMRRDLQHRLVPLFPDRITERSQDLPELVCPTGAVWWARTSVLIGERTFHVPDRTGWELPWQHAMDIDTEDDWQLAELLLRRSLTPETLDVR